MKTYTTWNKKGWLCAGLGLLLLIGAVWCWPARRGVLKGTVSIQGETLQSGSVVFVGPDSKPRTAAIQEDGSYTFTDLPIGEAKLAVFGSKRNRRMEALLKAFGGAIQLNGGEGKGGMKIVMSGGGSPKKTPLIPPAYNDQEQSGLRTTIRGGPNTYEIELK